MRGQVARDQAGEKTVTAVSITVDALKPVSLLRVPGQPAKAAQAGADAVTAVLRQVTAHPQAACIVGAS